MRVFVVGTGRCGTCTFYQACRHMTNFTAGHETGLQAEHPSKHPDNHIEISSGLFTVMGILMDLYPDAFWVHLIRERESCVHSLTNEHQVSMERFCLNWFHRRKPTRAVAELFYDGVNSTIGRCMQSLPPEKTMLLEMERANFRWREFWDRIGAEGDFDKSIAKWRRHYNPSGNRGRSNYYEYYE